MDERIGTICVQGGWRPGDGEPRQVPIYQNTTWKYGTSEAMGRLFDLEDSGYFYTRLANPTCDAVAAKIAELEAQELQGIMHRSEDVATLTEDLLYTIRDSLLALPGRLAVDVAATNTAAEAAEVIKREVFLVMKDLSSYNYDPEKYAERVRERMDWKAEHEGEDGDE